MPDTQTNQEDKELDESLKQTFPASDPFAPKHPTGTEPPSADPHRKTPEISQEDVRAATVATEECPRCRGTGRVVAASTADPNAAYPTAT
jgi:hypothetical protein